MTYSYANYTNISVNALSFNPRSQDIINKKQEIVNAISDYYKSRPSTILFLGFSPIIHTQSHCQIYVTKITNETKKYLDDSNIKYTYIDADDLGQYHKKFDWVVATDEYFTFAESEQDQEKNIKDVANLAKDVIVTTLKDYKNQEFKDREFSQPLAVYNGNRSKIFLEHHQSDFTDKNSWATTVYEIDGTEASIYGPFKHRSMFFKQLAKFSIDAGAKNFLVHKNLMYKSLIKKNYEHVISIKF